MKSLNEVVMRQRELAAEAGIKTVRAEAPIVKVNGTTATFRIYQNIDDWGEDWGLSETEFAQELDALPDDVDTIELRINSPGGMVFSAFTIMNALRSHSAKTVAVVEGMAASAAAFLAISADETIMMPNSRLMIHEARVLAYGTATDLRDMASIIDGLNLEQADIYAKKSGVSASDWLAVMAEGDRWYSAEEAVEAGLADRVHEDKDAESKSSAAPAAEPAASFDPALSLALLSL